MNKFKRKNGILLEPAAKGPLGTRNGAQGIVDFLSTLQIWESRALTGTEVTVKVMIIEISRYKKEKANNRSSETSIL